MKDVPLIFFEYLQNSELFSFLFLILKHVLLNYIGWLFYVFNANRVVNV